ncbi:universal stress protein [Sinomicrobium pectinilyticum]|uniref:Universal stress protein n=1 Tax=Sinomicrobium pectinilyticum TaxID=1084421 RepID=A0A3N0EJ28_SINP1|nr:universal stress protein [Sinomicrobium pectinilyticum]RNL87774.1 universal stress protein [Sinomicrobium pectinilyticum]
MKTIILPTDFSTNAKNAANYAMTLFKEEECKFIVLNAFGTDSATNSILLQAAHPAYEAALTSSQNSLKEFVEDLSSSDTGQYHSFEMVSKYNYLARAVNELIRAHDIYMVVMGIQGATGAKERWFGSNTVTVMESGFKCPVLVIPESAEIKVPQEIVFTTSLKRPYRIRDIAPLTELAEKHKSIIRILHTGDKEPDEEQQHNKTVLEERLNGVETFYHTLTSMNTEMAVQCFVESRGNIDMIAMVNRKHSLFNSIIRRPVVRSLGYHTKIPLLVMNRL